MEKKYVPKPDEVSETLVWWRRERVWLAQRAGPRLGRGKWQRRHAPRVHTGAAPACMRVHPSACALREGGAPATAHRVLGGPHGRRR